MAMFLKAFDRTKCFTGDDGAARRERRRAALKGFLVAAVKEEEAKARSSSSGGGETAAGDMEGESILRRADRCGDGSGTYSNGSGSGSGKCDVNHSCCDSSCCCSVSELDARGMDWVTPLGRRVFDI